MRRNLQERKHRDQRPHDGGAITNASAARTADGKTPRTEEFAYDGSHRARTAGLALQRRVEPAPGQATALRPARRVRPRKQARRARTADGQISRGSCGTGSGGRLSLIPARRSRRAGDHAYQRGILPRWYAWWAARPGVSTSPAAWRGSWGAPWRWSARLLRSRYSRQKQVSPPPRPRRCGKWRLSPPLITS